MAITTNFTNTLPVLQGNAVSFSVPLAEDRTVIGGYAKSYRYRYGYTPISCNTDSSTDYISYDFSGATYSDWYYVELNSDGSDAPEGEIKTTIPTFFTCDVAMRFEVQVQDDGTGAYYANDAENDTPVFIALYNRAPVFTLDHVSRNTDESIKIEYTVADTGLGKPSNFSTEEEFLGSAGWKAYINDILPAFNINSGTYITLTWLGSTDGFRANAEELLTISYEVTDISGWTPGGKTQEISLIEDILKNFSAKNNTYHRIELTYGIKSGDDFEFAVDSESKPIYSDILLLPASTPSFQIKRRGVKAHMLENDSRIGSFFTGAGMFNHGNEVGVDVAAEGGPKLDPAKGHSITLYDTHTVGDDVSNTPSIGFMSEDHRTMGYLKCGVLEDGRRALFSDLPIVGNHQEADDPGQAYTVSIDLILGNGTSKTIRFNGEIS